MIRVKFLREIAGLPAGTVHEWSDKNSGLARAMVARGDIEVIKEKAEEPLPVKQPEKVETKQAPKKPKK